MILNAETRTKNYLKFLGWQGGTIHQIAQEFNCDVDTLLYGTPEYTYTGSYYNQGMYATTCRLKYRLETLLPMFRGNVEYWLGVANGASITKFVDEA